MLRKPHDDLFTRIFDEGESGDTGMEWLRDGLKELREVPPHGLSNERLRDRLLGTGLAPAPAKTAPWWSWAWAPVAAAAIAVVVLPRFRAASEPTIVMKAPAVENRGSEFALRPPVTSVPVDKIGLPSAANVEMDPHEIEAAIASGVDLSTPSSAASSSATVSSSAVARSSSPRTTIRRSSNGSFNMARRNSAPTPVAPKVSSPLPNADVARGGLVAKASPNEGGDGLESTMNRAPSTFRSSPDSETMGFALARAEGSSDPLVLLTPDIDAATGAASATEIASPTNLSIGG